MQRAIKMEAITIPTLHVKLRDIIEVRGLQIVWGFFAEFGS